MIGISASSREEGCTIMAAWTPAKAPRPGQGLAEPGAGPLLLEGQLGSAVDPAAERQQLLPCRLDPLARGRLGVGRHALSVPAGRWSPRSGSPSARIR